MGSCGSRHESVSSGELQSVSPKESRPSIDPYIIPTSLDDSILLKDASRSYLTPTPYPAPVLKPHDRDAVPLSQFSPEHLRTFKLADVHPHRAKGPRTTILQCTSRTPSPLNTSTSPHALHSGPSSPASTSSTPSPSPSPPPLLLPSALAPTPSTRTTRLRPKNGTILVPDDIEKLKNGNMCPLLTPTLPPPAYTQHAIGQGGGRKDAGAARHWGWGADGVTDADGDVV